MKEKTELQFQRQADHIVDLVLERMSKYEDALWSGVAAIRSQSHGMDFKEWQRFSATLRIDERYQGINGIGVIYYIEPEGLETYLAQERKLRPDYKIHPTHS